MIINKMQNCSVDELIPGGKKYSCFIWALLLMRAYFFGSSALKTVPYVKIFSTPMCYLLAIVWRLVQQLTETGLRTQIITSLFELLLSTQYSLLKQQAIKVLCGIGVLETNKRLVPLLSDERLDVDVRGSIAAALAALAHDSSIIAEMTKSLQDERIFDDVFSALWTISRRLGVWIFPLPFTDHKGNLEQSQAQYEIVEWE